MKLDQLEAVQEGYLRAFIAGEGLSEATATLLDFVETDSIQFLVLPNDEKPISTFAGDVDESLLYKEWEYWEVNPRAHAIPSMRVDKVLRDHQIVSEEERDRNAAFQDLLIPGGFAHFAGALSYIGEEQTVALAGFNKEENGTVEDAHARRLSEASKIIRGVIKSATMFDANGAQRSLAMIKPGIAGALLDQNHRVVELNDAMRELIDQKIFTITSEGRISKIDTNGLTSLWKSRPTGNLLESQRTALHDANGRLEFVAELTDLPSVSGSLLGGTAFRILKLEPFAHPVLDKLLAIQAFNFTEAESIVLADLLTGYSLREIAQRRGTSVHTVRSQTKRILEKTQVSRQAQLMGLISKYLST
ncbi:MAG: hypothetical protein AAFV59_05155 [Pseudomonadota bacterium]